MTTMHGAHQMVRQSRSWADVAYLSIESFKQPLSAIVGFVVIIFALVFAWHQLRPDLQAVSSIVQDTARITSEQRELTKELRDVIDMIKSKP